MFILKPVFQRAVSILCSAFALMVYSCSAIANDAIESSFTIIVEDQHQNLIEDVVVLLPKEKISSSVVKSAIMDQQDKAFVPKVLIIDQNTLVSFPNSDNIRHHVYSFSQTKRFEIRLYADTPEKPILFDTPGVVVLGCNIHDSMVGYIFVSEWQHYALTDNNGLAELMIHGDLPSELLIWHHRLEDPSKPLKIEAMQWQQNETKLTIDLKPIPPKKVSRFR